MKKTKVVFAQDLPTIPERCRTNTAGRLICVYQPESPEDVAVYDYYHDPSLGILLPDAGVLILLGDLMKIKDPESLKLLEQLKTGDCIQVYASPEHPFYRSIEWMPEFFKVREGNLNTTFQENGKEVALYSGTFRVNGSYRMKGMELVILAKTLHHFVDEENTNKEVFEDESFDL